MGAWEDQLAQWGGPDWMAGAAGGFALDYLDAPPVVVASGVVMPTGSEA